jgi:hypothetical protein
MLKLDLQSFFTTSIRILLSICFCMMIFLSNALPASAATNHQDEGVAKLNDIQKRTDNLSKRADDIDKGDESVFPSLNEVQSASEEGLNEIQGAANKDKMIGPEDAKNTTTIQDKINESLSKVKGSK